MNMKNCKIKILSILIIFSIMMLPILTVANAANEEIAVLKTSENEYRIYSEKYLGKSFYYAFSDTEEVAESSLNFITSKQDTDGNQIAELKTTSEEAYMWTKESIDAKAEVTKVDLKDSMTKESVEGIQTVTKRISVDATQTATETTEEGDIIKNVTTGILKITDTANAKFYYQTTLLTKETTDYNRLMELTKQAQGELNNYQRIKLAQEYEELFTKLTSQANWTEVVDKTIKQPANANDGEQYVVLLRKVENGNTTYDAQFLTSSKQTKQEVVEKVVSTTKNTELPVTYDNPILFVVLAITVALLVIIGIKIAKARKNENQK